MVTTFGWSGPRPAPGLSRLAWRIGDPEFAADRFDRPRRASPWAGHRWFAHDLIGALQPRRVVELGTHYGCSFFAFCQAVLDHRLPTELIAVDTWEGDPHAGEYEGVYELVGGWVAEHYSTLDTRLVRSTFDEALAVVEPQSVGLLHIDGFHSFEAVSHDYHSWLDRLAPDATVLFHDVDPQSGYGSAAFWDELVHDMGGWTFLHNFGLGVLTRDARLAATLASDEFDMIGRYYAQRAAADLLAMQVADQGEMLAARQLIVDRQDELIADRDRTIVDQAAMIDAKQAVIDSQAAMIDAKQAIIDNQAAMIDDRDTAIAAQAAYIDAKQDLIESQDRLIADRDRRLEQLSQQA